ncbi:hypothetical protein ONE63_002362 [Megalurothrips usitatus]|uniref:Nudix hydrolase domain-containing protein n=1 Tax=Megalurothrips usitatus TaxID=439358 RepID=A0AAV7XF00_9NEOP|nr:hypothetical protein ONE63_002362 [Megalurothrips usitatus]
MASYKRSSSPFLKIAKKFNCFYINGLPKRHCKPFVVEGHQVGLVRPDIMVELLRYPEVFIVRPDSVELNPAFRDFDERTARVEQVLQECRANNTFVTLKGWRNECYNVHSVLTDPPLLRMDRSATCLFGIRNYGVTVNGFVHDSTRGLCMWLQRRSPTKETWPGKWDNMVSGGLSVGYGVIETAIKEAQEEAGIPENMLKDIRPAGAVSFFFESERGLFPNTEYVFDLKLPSDFIPKNNDGEVETFDLLSINELKEMIASPDFKTTSSPIVIDFLVRHGVISPETGGLGRIKEPNYAQLLELLHVPLQTIYHRAPPSENGDKVL